MRISHACAGCGADLTYVRAAPDPWYGLPVVVCAACRMAVVRRRPAALEAAKRYRQVRAALCGLIVRLWLLGISLPAFLFATNVLTDTAMERWGGAISARGVWRDEGVVFKDPLHDQLLGATGAGFWVGAWVVGMLPHWRPWRAVMAFGALAGVIALGDAAFAALAPVVGRALGARWVVAPVTGREVAWELGWIAYGTAAAMGLGLPLGLALRASFAKRRSRRWRKALARARLGRSGTC